MNSEFAPVKFASLHIYDLFNGVKNAECGKMNAEVGMRNAEKKRKQAVKGQGCIEISEVVEQTVNVRLIYVSRIAQHATRISLKET